MSTMQLDRMEHARLFSALCAEAEHAVRRQQRRRGLHVLVPAALAEERGRELRDEVEGIEALPESSCCV